MERRLLQIAVCAACAVPIMAGIYGILDGTRFETGIDLDSHVRYLSGLLLGIGLCFLTTVPGIERRQARFPFLTFLVTIGGLARLYGFVTEGVPGSMMQFALLMELGVCPLLCLWQRRFSQRYAATS